MNGLIEPIQGSAPPDLVGPRRAALVGIVDADDLRARQHGDR